MAWDRQTLEGEIQNEVDDFEAASLTVIRQGINDVSRTIWFRHPWSFREATGYLDTDGTNHAFTISDQISNVAKINEDGVGFKGTNETAYRPLRFIPYMTFLRLYATAAPAVGNPSVWTMYAGQIIFDSIPEALTESVQITHEIEFTDLTGDASVPLIPEKYRHVIKSGVKATFWDFDDDLRAANEWRKFEGNSYERGVGGLIGDMIVEDNENPRGSHRQMLLGQTGVIFGKR